MPSRPAKRPGAAQTDPDAAVAFDDDDQLLQNAAFGLAQVEFKKRKKAPNVLSKFLGGAPSAVAPAPTKRATTKSVTKASSGGNRVKRLLQRLLFYDAVVAMVVVPLRIGFYFDPYNRDTSRFTWTRALAVFAALDGVSTIVKVLPIVYGFLSTRQLLATSRRGSDSNAVSTMTTFRMMSRLPSKITPDEVTMMRAPSNRQIGSEERESLRRIPTAKRDTVSTPRWIARCCAKIVGLTPWELGLCLIGEYNLAHVGGVLRFALSVWMLPKLFTAGILKQFRSSRFVRSLSFSTVSLVFHSTWTGLYLCHLSAAGYMLIAHIECGVDFSDGSTDPVPACWVLKDNLQHGSIWRQYVRTMYWASKTVTTLGQGDLVPSTDMETNYCICVQFISGLWATSCLSACGFLFSRRDANMRQSTATHFEQSIQFLSARKLVPSTVVAVMSYYRYMQRSREGVDESSVLEGLPTRYRAQCSHQIKQDLVKRIPFFRKHEGAFLRAILDVLEQDFFSSQQIIVDFGDYEELLIVSTGEVRVSDKENVVVRRLLAGNYYADQALTQASLSQHRLVAEAPSEIWWLTRRSFERTVQHYFPVQKRAAILGRRSSYGNVPEAAGVGSEPKDIALRKLMDKVDRDTARSVESVAMWRLPSSRFRVNWRTAECVCLLYVAIEVPIHIAFNRDFGLLDPNGAVSSSAVLKARFVSTLAVELFFYCSWYLRACVFVRRSTDNDGAEEGINVRDDSQQNLIVDSKQIFRHYLEHDDLLSDAVSSIPVSIIWDVFAKKSTPPIVIVCMALFRLLRVLRLQGLQKNMKFVMTRRNLSPPTQMLILNCVVCVLLANAAASVYYTVGGLTTSGGSVVRALSSWRHRVTASSCLSDASIFGNCTWYLYDYSEFGIDSAYLRSLHWSLVLLSTVGYGDILAFSNAECVVGFFWIYAGAIICYFTASAVSSVISHWRVLNAVKNEKLEEITRTLMSFKTLSPATTSMIQRYYVATWKMNGSAATENDVLLTLPKSLRVTITRELYTKVGLCRIFAECVDSSLLVHELAATARALVFLAGVKVIRQGHSAHEAFIIQSGAVEMYAETEAQQLLPQLKTDGRQTTGRARFRSNLMDSYSSLNPRRTDDNGEGPHKIHATTALSIAVLRKSDMFGEESVSSPDLSAYALSARTLATTQVIVLRRDAFLALRDRFSSEIGKIMGSVHWKVDQDRYQLDVIRRNFMTSRKLFKVVGLVDNTQAQIEENRVTEPFIIHPENIFAKVWSVVVASVLLFNFYQIVFRLAFLSQPDPQTVALLSGLDYTFDFILATDMFLKWNHFGYTDYTSGDILDRAQIRRHYYDGWFKWDVLSMIPIYFPKHPFKMAVARLPRLLKSPQLMDSLRVLEEKVHEHFISGGTVFLSVFDMIKFLLFFLSAAHYLGSCYYLLGRLQLEYRLVTSSWITSDAVLSAYPERVVVHYIRSVYWCLETFTVVCFGDVIARNAAETIYASATCILGWVFIGQIIGRMTSLVLNLDKEAQDHIERVNDFEEYAKRRSLPLLVRERAKECAEYKSKTILELNAREVLQDLPTQLRMEVFDEAYGDLIRNIPEFNKLSKAHVQALASAFTLEIFMRRDVIFSEGRVLTRLYIMKEGRGELYSAASSIVLASIHEGVMFGDVAFFLPGVKNVASARAHTSCQVVQLEKSVWKSLWPDHVRRAIEEQMMPVIREKQRVTTESYLNVVKNFELSKAAIPQRPTMLRRNRTLRAMVLAEKGKLERQLLVCYAIRAPKKTRLSIRLWFQSFWNTARDILDRVVRRTPSEADGPATSLLPETQLAGSPQSRMRLRAAIAKIRPARPDKETLWSRHANKLRVLRMLDVRKVQAEADLNGQSQHSRIEEHRGGRRSTRTQGLARRKSTGAPSDLKQLTDLSAMSNMSHNPSAASSRSSREENSAQLRRHSIQLNHDDLLRKLETLKDVHGKDGTSSDANFGPNTLLKRPMPSRDYRSHSTTQPKAQAAPPLLTRGKSSFSLLPHAPPMRQRSNSFHELLAANGVRRRMSFFAKAVGDAITNVFKPLQSESQLYGIWSEPPQPPSFVLQGSGFRRCWDVLMLAICLYYVLVVPFRASFDYEFLSQSESKTSVEAWFFLEFIMDAMCWADFLLHKNYFAFVHRGEIVTNSRSIRDHYFREGTYIVDLISLLPLEVLAAAIPSLIPGIESVTWYHISVLRLNKVTRIVHLHELSERLQQMLIYDFKLKLVRRSLLVWIRFTFDFALGAHWVACFAYAVAFNSYKEDGRASWLTAPGMLTFAGCDGLKCIGTTPVSTRYARSYHFSMGAITTVSYGDIAPLNAAETCATIVVIIATIILFGMLSGGFFQLFEMEIGRRADYEQRVAHVAQYMQFHRFQPRMWKQMQVYFAVHWAESKGMNEDVLLRGLTASVKQDIAFFVMEDFVKNMKLFATAEPAFARAVVSAFQQELFVRNDIIIREGDTERSLYVIESGLVSVRITNKATLEQIEVIKGRYEFIGEKSLIFNVPRSATCVALCACSVLILTLEKYEHILDEFPDYREKNVREWMFTRGGARPKHALKM